MIEYLTPLLGVTTGIAAVLAYVYHRGKGDGIDSACEKRIKDKITKLEEKINARGKEDDIVHSAIFKKVDKVDSKLDKLTGTTIVIRDLITQHLSNKSNN